MYNEQYTLVSQQIQVCMTLINIVGEMLWRKEKNTIIMKRSEDFLIFLGV